MANVSVLKREYGACLEAMNAAFLRGDESAFLSAVDHIVQTRTPKMLSEIRKLTGDLQQALDRFSIESRLADIAENEIPGARARLTHVINMTDEAAHRTLDLVERSGPLAERTAREAAALLEAFDTYRARPPAVGFEGVARAVEAFLPVVRSIEAFLPAARADSEQIRRNLADVLLAQGYQDLTGQIIRSVIKLVEELEHALGDLTALSGGRSELTPIENNPSSAGYGPVVPGVTKGEVASAQTDVDALLSGLGM
jgi:chemotaxis protein CheZ